jgi:hypothetical protein
MPTDCTCRMSIGYSQNSSQFQMENKTKTLQDNFVRLNSQTQTSDMS